MERIGVRELRQHAGRYLARVSSGETFEITDRGRVVARLVPPGIGAWAHLVASGKVTLADGTMSIVDEVPGDYGIKPSEALAAMRDHNS
jgi:prevent-host-death family protein